MIVRKIDNNGKPKVVFVGTFPPAQEGIATFNSDLVSALHVLTEENCNTAVCAVNLTATSPYYFDKVVEWEIDQSSLKTYEQAAHSINRDPQVKAVVIQHEYGIYGGTWGRYLVTFLKALKVPVIIIFHTVLKSHYFKPEMFEIVTREVLENSDIVVVLSNISKQLIYEKYKDIFDKPSRFLPSRGLYFIEHGIHHSAFVSPSVAKKDMRLDGKTVLTTFGLLSEGKGIEYVLNALPSVVEKNPDVIYQVLGQTHPVIRKKEGEKYRIFLSNLVKKLKLKNHVYFLDKFLSDNEITKSLNATDLYIATSTNENQSVSGTLSYALGTGRAVVSTEFTQAKEMVTRSVGRLVPVKNSESFAKAINEILKDRRRLYRMHKAAYVKSRSMLWSNVAFKYTSLIEDTYKNDNLNLILPKINLEYLSKMTKDKGVLQFAKYDIPEKEFGYTLDDNSRAAIVISWLISGNYNNTRNHRLLAKYFNFLLLCQKGDGGFINYLDLNYQPADKNNAENIEESMGRAVWALSEIISNKSLSRIIRNAARRSFNRVYAHIPKVSAIRTKAFMIKALATIQNTQTNGGAKIIDDLASDLVKRYRENQSMEWKWFESQLSYNNGILPESLFWAYKVTGKKEYLKVGKITLDFLIRKTFMDEIYVPIGQKSWLKLGKRRNLYDQQPEDTSSSVLALITSYEVTSNKYYLTLAKRAFSWFLGNNLNGIPLYNQKTHGVFDALTPEGVNKNQGAEALIGYLLARAKIDKYY